MRELQRKVMITIMMDPKDASLADAMRELDLAPEDVDSDFGLVNINPHEHLYTLLVDEHAASKVQSRDSVVGTHSNPVIGTMGPPESNKSTG